jgi:malate dehydrogenase (oxaloacetate-decarboxylating)
MSPQLHHEDDDSAKPKFSHLPLSTSGPLKCALKGTVLLNHSYFNKGSAFTQQERHDFELSGLLPQSVQTLDQQVQRAYEQYSARPDDLAKNTFLTSMNDQNEVLYFKVRRWCYAGGCRGIGRVRGLTRE